MAITSLIIDLSGTVSFTNNTVAHFHGSNQGNNVTYSQTGAEGYQASADIANEADWEAILSNLFVNFSWSIADLILAPTGVAADKAINDLVVRFTVRITTDGNNANATYAFPPGAPNPGLGTGTHFEVATTYQDGRLNIVNRNLQADAVMSEVTGDPTSLAVFQAVLNAALENVDLTIDVTP